MSGTQKFLDEVRANLRKYPSGAVDDYLDYYAELIAERVASGETESAVLHKIGNPKDVAAGFKQDEAIDRAVKKPTASNGLKALIAALGVLSLPLLIPAIAVVGVMLVVAVLFGFVGVVALLCGVVASVVGVVDAAAAVIAGDAPFYLLLLAIGIALIVLTLSYELFRGLLFLSRKVIHVFISRLHARRLHRKQPHLAGEER